MWRSSAASQRRQLPMVPAACWGQRGGKGQGPPASQANDKAKGSGPSPGATGLTYAAVVEFLKQEGLESAHACVAAAAQAKPVAPPKAPTTMSAWWKVENLKKKIQKAEARSAEVIAQRDALEQELDTIKQTVDQGKQDLVAAQGVLAKLQTGEHESSQRAYCGAGASSGVLAGREKRPGCPQRSAAPSGLGGCGGQAGS